MYRKILYIPQPCTEKIRERERERGGGEERGGERERGGKRGEREGGDRGETGGRQGGDRGETGGERKRKLIFFFRTNEWQTSTKTPAPLIFL